MRRALRRALPRHDDAGFTLVEVMMACVILGILATAVLGLILTTQSQNVTNRSRIAASNLAAREMDLVRDQFHRSKTAPVEIATQGTVVNPHPMDDPSDGGSHTDEPFVIDGKQFTITRTASWDMYKGGTSACDGGEYVTYPTLAITVSVTWPNMGSVKPVVSTAQLAPDKGFGIPDTDSFVAVRVSDENNERQAGRSVKISGGGQTTTVTTDGSGCAVVEVSPAVGVGTDYTAQVVDLGYVDTSSTAQPTKDVGFVGRGQLANNVAFQVARAGTAHVDLVDSTGAPVAHPPAGAIITLDPSESSASAVQVPITGPSVEVHNLWPTEYRAYYGDTPPATGTISQTLEPGGTVTLTAVLQLADTTVAGLPAGAVLQAVAGDAATCTGATTLGTSNGTAPIPVHLPPGDWSFFAVFPYAACSPGPQPTLVPGTNGAITWAYSTVTSPGLAAGSTLHLAEQSKVTNVGTATTCPTVQAGMTLDVPAAGLAVPAGTWVVWASNASGQCAKPSNPPKITTLYGQDAVVSWAAHQVTLRVTGVKYVGSKGSSYYWPTVYITQTPLSGLTCTGGTNGGVRIAATNAKLSAASYKDNKSNPTTSGNNRDLNDFTAQDGPWYVIANDQNGNNNQSPRWTGSGNASCKLAGTVTIDAFSASPTSLTYAVVG